MVSLLFTVRTTLTTTGGRQALQPDVSAAIEMPKARCRIQIGRIALNHWRNRSAVDLREQGFASMDKAMHCFRARTGQNV